VRAFYDNTDMLNTIREKMRIRGFGFDFETKYDQYDSEGNLKEEVEEPNYEAADGSEPEQDN